MRSPFEIFRRHQKTLTVILTGLAMFAFVILGAVPDPNNMPPTLVAVVLAGILGGVGWVAGIGKKKSKEWAFSGVIAGLVLGIAAMFAVGPQDIVRADTGNIDQRQLDQLIQRRQLANQFVYNAVQRARKNGAQLFQQPQYFGFGYPDLARDVVIGELLRREADRLGVEVSNDAVNGYIVSISEGQVGPSDMEEIRSLLRIPEKELYDILRLEIQAQRVAGLLYSNTTLPPQSYWEFYRQMNIQQSVGLVPVPVAAFVDHSAEPPEAELQELFARYKTNYPNRTNNGRVEEGRPGFRQPRKVRLAYVEVPYEAVEAAVGEIPDEEIEAFYEEHYKQVPFTGEDASQPDEWSSESGPDMPILPELEGANDPSVEKHATDPESGKADPPQQPPADTPASEAEPIAEPPQAKEEEAAPESDSPDDSTSSSEAENKESPKGGDSGASLPQPADLQFVALLDDAVAVDDKSSEAPDETTAEAVSDVPHRPAADESTPATGPPPPPIPRMREAGDSETAPQPRELDDELRAEIRDQILRARTVERMQQLVSEVFDEMSLNLGYFVTLPEDDNQFLSHAQAGEKLRAFAEERGLVYEETPLLSSAELSESEEYPIGRAASDSNPQMSRTVPELAFEAGPTELFRAESVLEIESGSRFVFWKIEDEQAYEPSSLDDPEIRVQVVKTWRELQARELARKRAKQLARQAEGVDKPLSEVFAETTITGEADAQVVSVVHTPRFTWLSHANVSPNPYFRPPPTLTNLRSVPGRIGEEFMKTIVNDLQVGEVGVTHSVDMSYFFVARVDDRIYGLSPDFQSFRERFQSERVFAPIGYSDYPMLARMELGRYDINWAEELFARHNVDFSLLDQRQSQSSG